MLDLARKFKNLILERKFTVRNTKQYTALAVVLAALGGCATAQMGGAENMTFFVTGTNPGKVGDLGGIDGADRHCQALASAAGPARGPGAPT